MSLVLNVITEPTVEPITVEEAKVQIRVDFSEDDAAIQQKISAARRICEVHTKRSFISTTWEAVYDSFPYVGGGYTREARQFYSNFGMGGMVVAPSTPITGGEIILPRANLLSVNSITYLDSDGVTQTLDPANYRVKTGAPGRITPSLNQMWPLTAPLIGAVSIEFVAGYGPAPENVPQDVKEAILVMVTYLYENRGECYAELPAAVCSLLSSADYGVYN